MAQQAPNLWWDQLTGGRVGIHGGGEILGAPETLVWIFREAAVHRLSHPGRHPRRDHGDPWRGLGHVLVDDGWQVGALERQPARQGVEGRDAEGIEIAAAVHRLAGGLLGAHVVDGPNQLAFGRHGVGLGDPGDPEVGHKRPLGAFLQQDVVGLDVAMYHALLVRVGKGPRHLLDDPRRLGRWKRAAAPDTLAEGLAVHVGHDEIHEVATLFH